MRKETDATERSSDGTERVISEPGFGEFGPVAFGSTSNPWAEGTGNDGGELPPTDGGSARGNDTSGGVLETEPPKKRRGRPPGSKSTATASARGKSRLSDAELAAARTKLAESLGNGIGFGFSYYGTVRAKRYKTISPVLANRVYGCYQIPPQAAYSVGEPLADSFIAWCPQYVEGVSKSIDPALAIGRLISILQQTAENERLVVLQWQQTPQDAQQGASGVSPNGNGQRPPGTPFEGHQNVPESDVEEWMRGQGPSPEEVLETPQTHIPTSSP
jgi:hypothetical protein